MTVVIDCTQTICLVKHLRCLVRVFTLSLCSRNRRLLTFSPRIYIQEPDRAVAVRVRAHEGILAPEYVSGTNTGADDTAKVSSLAVGDDGGGSGSDGGGRLARSTEASAANWAPGMGPFRCVQARKGMTTIIPACTRRDNFASIDLLFRSDMPGDFHGFVRGVTSLHDPRGQLGQACRPDTDIAPNLPADAVRIALSHSLSLSPLSLYASMLAICMYADAGRVLSLLY